MKCTGWKVYIGGAEWLKRDYYRGSDAAVCQQRRGQWCPAAMLCLRSIRGEQPIKVLLRFTQQLKLNRMSELSGLFGAHVQAWRGAAACRFQHPIAFTQPRACFTGKKKVRHRNCGGRAGTVDGGERGVDSRLPLHLPCPHPVMHHCVHW